MENIAPRNVKDIDSQNLQGNVLVFPAGSDLPDALHTLLLQPRWQELLLWLVTKLIVSRDLDEWLKDFGETAEENPQLAQMVHAFLILIVHLDNEEDDADRFPIIAKAIQRRIATGLYRKLD